MFAKYLKAELINRCTANQAYSLRAMALFLKVSPPRISEWMNNKHSIKITQAKVVLKQLNCPEKKYQAIIQHLESLEYLQELKKKSEIKKINKSFQSAKLSDDQFKKISKWHYYAIINFLDLSPNQHHANYIAQRLGISTTEVEEAITSLIQLNILSKKDGVLKIIQRDLSTDTDIPSSSIKDFHSQMSIIAKKVLYSTPVEQKDFTNIMMPINIKNLDLAKKEIMNFRQILCRLLESGEKTEVYNLAIQLFPITKEVL